MGNACCGGSSDSDNGPDIEERRRLQAEAADKRHKENEARGLKDPEGAKKRIEEKAAAARELEKGGNSRDGAMKWQVG